MSGLLRLYPVAWRERYEPEVAALLRDRPPSALDRLDLLRGAVDAHVNPQVGPLAVAAADLVRSQRRWGGIAAVAGTVWILAALRLFLATPIPTLGYKDSATSFVLMALATILATGAVALVGGLRSAASARPWLAVMTIGGLAMVLPWPIFALGFLLVALGAAGLGMTVALAGARLIGGLLIATSSLTLGFNTEDARVLLLVPFGIAWLVAGAWIALGGALAAGPDEQAVVLPPRRPSRLAFARPAAAAALIGGALMLGGPLLDPSAVGDPTRWMNAYPGRLPAALGLPLVLVAHLALVRNLEGARRVLASIGLAGLVVGFGVGIVSTALNDAGVGIVRWNPFDPALAALAGVVLLGAAVGGERRFGPLVGCFVAVGPIALVMAGGPWGSALYGAGWLVLGARLAVGGAPLRLLPMPAR